ncbi:MAG: peptidoglycan-binding protein [Gammaproteobacteria bacterium]|nr:peptidoglycan-binding protein [Gammaproteobacteria bacterium]
MALTSPRFTSSRRLFNASNNAPPLRMGARRGRAVHLIQFALLDLGYAMPRSTGGSYSPDGIYGNETVGIVKAFQRSRHITDDGEVGRDTLRHLEAAFPRPSHRLRLHFRSLALTNVPFQQSFRNARTVYGQYGIDVQFGSGESLHLTPAQAALFDRIDQNCVWTLSTGEYDQLHRLGSHTPPFDIKVYFVRQLRGALGCGGHAPGRPAATVAAAAWRWDMAHEVGHVLLTSSFRGPVHAPHIRNLMNAFPPDNSVIKVLTDAQVRQMRSHACCH